MIEFRLIGLDPMAVPVGKLRAISDPLLTPPWFDRAGVRIAPIRAVEVKLAIDRGDILPSHWGGKWSFAREDHIARIAALAVDKDPTPIDVDVGFPDHGYFAPWAISDGNHRFCAAIVRGDQFIEANVRGDTGQVEKLLGIVPLLRVVT
ncbi:hypothetical protein [Bradyrhizobium prioriisuperbiae]|uniref:hypothetical protein n=1 Tax=Bradyrhizobium prioriisuperbiae TaxID=2854389 RepID=UPI0028EE7A7C|nr:hypothetical protein [Bradyrhizobium prioritasuperba]